MRLPAQDCRRHPLRFEITPLIDIVFLLIIFFLVASHVVRSDHTVPVDLPYAQDGSDDEEPAWRLTLTLLPDGQCSVGGTIVSSEDVRQRIARLPKAAADNGMQPEVRIRADRRGRFRAVRHIIEDCARHNITSIQFAVSEHPL